jgi:hypothetical protein
MCYTCGCKLPYEDHGDSNNIVEEHLKKAGQTEAVKKGGTKTAKENMHELLMMQIEKGEIEKPEEDYSN